MSRDIPQHEFMSFLFRTIVSLWLIWAIIGVAGYWELAQYLGWDRLGIEANVSIFFAITIAGLIAIAVLAYLSYRLIRLLRQQ